MDFRRPIPGESLRRTRLIILAAVALTTGCSLLQDDIRPPTITLVSITPDSGSITELGFRCRLKLDNPNDIALPIEGGELQLTLAERAAARGRLVDDVTVPAHGSAAVDTVVVIDVMSAVSIIAGLIDRPDGMLQYEVEGYIDVGVSRLGRIRFDDSGEFSLTGVGDLIRAGL